MEVAIRPLREEDAYTSVKWRNDSEVFKFTGNTYKMKSRLRMSWNGFIKWLPIQMITVVQFLLMAFMWEIFI